jgi:hypothetical protein
MDEKGGTRGDIEVNTQNPLPGCEKTLGSPGRNGYIVVLHFATAALMLVHRKRITDSLSDEKKLRYRTDKCTRFSRTLHGHSPRSRA